MEQIIREVHAKLQLFQMIRCSFISSWRKPPSVETSRMAPFVMILALPSRTLRECRKHLARHIPPLRPLSRVCDQSSVQNPCHVVLLCYHSCSHATSIPSVLNVPVGWYQRMVGEWASRSIARAQRCGNCRKTLLVKFLGCSLGVLLMNGRADDQEVSRCFWDNKRIC